MIEHALERFFGYIVKQHNLEIKKMTEDWDKFEKALLAIKKKGTPASKIEYEEKSCKIVLAAPVLQAHARS